MNAEEFELLTQKENESLKRERHIAFGCVHLWMARVVILACVFLFAEMFFRCNAHCLSIGRNGA